MIYGIRSRIPVAPPQEFRGTRSRRMPRRPGREQFRRITDVRDDSEISRVLAIAAHPDDLDFGAAGTIAAWTGAGIDVVYCIVTDGDAGGFDETFPRAEMAPLRRAEQIAAANYVGVHAELWPRP